MKEGKTCSRCGWNRPRDDFYTTKRLIKGVITEVLSSKCKCCSRIEGNWAAKRRKSTRIKDLSPICEICGGVERLAVDHDHDTGLVRGRLCRGCNVGIGNFRESVPNLRAAILYLQRTAGHKAKSSMLSGVIPSVVEVNHNGVEWFED